ncbi:MAG: ATPase [Gammaproteobacteria bacterium]|nr:ATPase [Gammaproteobacteria bacterium]
MLHGLRMQRVTFHLMTDEVPRAALELASAGCFSPDLNNNQYKDVLTSTPAQEYRELYQSAQNRYDKVYEHLDVELPAPPLDFRWFPSIEKLRDVDAWLAELWAECSDCEEHQREAEEEMQLIRSLQRSLHNFYGLDIDLNQLRQKKSFLDLQVGVVPEENLSRLRQAAGLAGYIIEVFHREKHQTHVLIAGLLGHGEDNMQSVLHAAGYRTFPIPEAFRDTPKVIHDELIKSYEELQADRNRHVKKRITRANEEMDDLLACWRTLKLVEPVFKLGNSARCKGELAVIHGWIPEKELPVLAEQLEQALNHPLHIESHEPVAEEYDRVPTVIRYPRWLSPFVTLTRNFGTPRYAEVDPTWIFAISSVLLFGMMFGDIGHGAVLFTAAIALRKVLKQFTYLLLANGISSTFFGFMYGSIFGNEHLLTPLWHSPLHDPVSVLLIAVYIGVAFVGLSILLNIYNHITVASYQRALFSPGGLPGLLGLISLVLFFTLQQSPAAMLVFPVLLLTAALGMMAHYLWQTNTSPKQERLIVVSIELFESLISLVSNVLSFLRVGAFTLNHVALMLAVYAIAEMLPDTGYWIIMVLGNLFVIVFEAAIVMIQVLRLEYYEGLSRYFQGDGNVFVPLTLAEPNTRYRYT